MRNRINQCICKPFTVEDVRASVFAQLENPTIHQVDRAHVSANCTAWEANDVFFQFSPDTGQTVSASTHEEAHAPMHEILKAWVAKNGKDVEAVPDTSVVKHLFDLQ